MWLQPRPTSTQDYLDTVLPSKEAILEAMMGFDRPWDDLHHHSYFLPLLREIESSLSSPSTSDVHTILNPLALAQFFVEGNMSVISRTIPVNISRNPNVIKNVFIEAKYSLEEIQVYTDLFKEFRDMFTWYFEEMPRIDPSIV